MGSIFGRFSAVPALSSQATYHLATAMLRLRNLRLAESYQSDIPADSVAGFVTSTKTAGGSSSPTLRGF